VSETDTHTDEAAIAGHTRGSKVSSRFTLAVCLLLVLGMCAFWLISNYNTQNLLRQQADELGSTVAEQTALQMTEFVLANDRISMNVVLGELIRGTSITELAVINTDNEIIAIATQSLPRPSAFIPLPIALSREQADYEAPISLRGASAGSIRLVLDLSAIEVTIINNLLMVVRASSPAGDRRHRAHDHLFQLPHQLPREPACRRARQHSQRRGRGKLRARGQR
jgi:uncharacterized membrane protein affecting hemolysin expression